MKCSFLIITHPGFCLTPTVQRFVHFSILSLSGGVLHLLPLVEQLAKAAENCAVAVGENLLGIKH